MSAPADPAVRSHRRLPMFGETEGPVLVGLPAPVQARQAVHLPDRDELSPAAFELLSAVRDTLLAPPGTGVCPRLLSCFCAHGRSIPLAAAPWIARVDLGLLALLILASRLAMRAATQPA